VPPEELVEPDIDVAGDEDIYYKENEQPRKRAEVKLAMGNCANWARQD